MNIVDISAQRLEYIELLLTIWEKSVSKTHNFLTVGERRKLLPEGKKALLDVPLLYFAEMTDGTAAGFMGIADSKLEMLFLAPDFFRRKIGSRLLDFAINKLGVVDVDVNEDNFAARKFYEHCGFTAYHRSATDEQGNPFPILHLTLKVLETERLVLRRMKPEDFSALCLILQDPEVMRAYEGAFTAGEVNVWLEKQLRRYRDDGVGLWAVILRENGRIIGQCGLTIQHWKDRDLLEVGYLFQKAYWHKGYATEAARGCMEYAFEKLNAEAIYSIIRDMNISSRRVAERNQLSLIDTGVRHYRGIDMPHYLYERKNPHAVKV